MAAAIYHAPSPPEKAQPLASYEADVYDINSAVQQKIVLIIHIYIYIIPWDPFFLGRRAAFYYLVRVGPPPGLSNGSKLTCVLFGFGDFVTLRVQVTTKI